LDAETFASWDVDYIKLDGCYAELQDMETGNKLFWLDEKKIFLFLFIFDF
jgi:Alpha galactosidase A